MSKPPISVTHPEVAAQLKDQSLAGVLTHGSTRRVVWVCKDCSNEWESKLNNRTGSSRGCPYCAGQRAVPGKTDLATLRPDLASELKDQSLATVLMPGSNRRVVWVCKPHGHEYEAAPNRRTSDGGRGCGYCSGKRVLTGFNDLGTLRPDLACELKDPSLASVLSAGTKKKVAWVCKDCANEWETQVASRAKLGSGCPSCSGNGGFDQTKPGWVYVVSQPSLHSEDAVMVKLGITNLDNLKRRLTTHARQGLTEVLALSAYPEGGDALARERIFKCYLRDLPGEYRVSRDELPDGFSEAFLSTAPEWEAEAFCE